MGILGICPFAERIDHPEDLKGYSAGGPPRVGFCDHTAGGFLSTMRRASFWNDPNGDGSAADAVSVHFAIGRKGEILQVVNIFDTAFAQGRLGPVVSWPPYAAMGKGNPNGYLISTEHEDVESVNGRTVYVPGSQWTEAQYAADSRVKQWCVEECRKVRQDVLKFGIDSLAGHHMFDAVNRAECPGRYWRNEYQQRLYADLTAPPPVPAPEGTDEMQPHVAIAQWFTGRVWNAPTPPGEMWNMKARQDLNLSVTARGVRLLVETDGQPIRFFHGGTDVEAPAFPIPTMPNAWQIEVVLLPGEEGLINFRTEGPVAIRRITCNGYW